MRLVEMLEPTEGESCQWLGVYVTKWQREWGKPSAMFRDLGKSAIAVIPEVKALVDAVSALLDTARREYKGTDWTVSQWLADEPTVAALDAALDPFRATPEAGR